MARRSTKKKTDQAKVSNTKKSSAKVKGLSDTKDLSLLDIMHFAEKMANQMQDFHDILDKSLFKEFHELSHFISNMRTEVGRLQAKDLSEAHIPEAGEELSAIVDSTEEATNSIMESAEAIMAADASDPDAYQSTVNTEVMKIFEACSFQDLTGQRISKVFETFSVIEERINHFAGAIGALDDKDFMTDVERKRAKRKEDLLLNGPQSKKDAIKQTTVDDMFSSDQSTIDSLFD